MTSKDVLDMYIIKKNFVSFIKLFVSIYFFTKVNFDIIIKVRRNNNNNTKNKHKKNKNKNKKLFL